MKERGKNTRMSAKRGVRNERMQQEREKTSVKEKRNVCKRKEKETSACKRKEKRRVQKSKVSTRKQAYADILY